MHPSRSARGHIFSRLATLRLSEETKDEKRSVPAHSTCLFPLFGHSLSFLTTGNIPTPCLLRHRGLILYLYPPHKRVKWVGHSPCRLEVNRGMGSWGKAAWAWGSDSNNSSSKGMEWGARGILCGAAQAPGGTPSPICWP